MLWEHQLGLCVPASNNPSDYPVDYKKQRGYTNIPNAINRLVICLSSQWGDPSNIMKDLNISSWQKIKTERIK
jgi:hypothetical protein